MKFTKMNEPIRVCVGGATGWAGSVLAKSILKETDLEMVSAISRSNAGENLVDILQTGSGDIPIFASAAEAMNIVGDVYVEYTKPDVAKNNIITALNNGFHVVIGTSGLTEYDYEEIDQLATQLHRGVLAVGNFAITVVLLQKFSEIAAKYIPSWEIIDYAHAGKVDTPSGTVRELVYKLGQIRASKLEVPIHKITGPKETRGANMNGSQVHSVRLPGHVIGVETIFGQKDEKLTIRHDAGASAEPYVEGALLAIRKVGTLSGLHRGLDTVMDF